MHLARRTLPLVIALFLGLTSFIILMMISKYAPFMTLALAGILSLAVIIITTAILWNLPPAGDEEDEGQAEAEAIPEPPLPLSPSENNVFVHQPENLAGAEESENAGESENDETRAETIRP